MRRASYEIVENIPGDPLLIRDIGPWDQHPTVTNVAEDVVNELFINGYLWDGRQLFYIDSDGQRDEIVIKGGRFSGFAPGS